MLALLAGFMLGSLNQLWPWQSLGGPLALGNHSLKVPQYLSPIRFQAVYQQDPLVVQALLWMSLGILLVVGVERQIRSPKLKLDDGSICKKDTDKL